MKGELETHLDTTKPLSGNRRNGKMTDDSFYKLVYLAYRNIRKKWTMPLANWGQTAQQLAIKFGDRFKIM